VWAFDPATTTWEDISPTSGPSPDGFYRNGLVYDSTSNVIIMYGTKENSLTAGVSMGPWVYSFDTRTWEDMSPNFWPGGRGQNQQMAYDSENNVTVITGNGTGTWLYKYKNAAAAPEMLGDFDFDSDVDGADFLAWQRGSLSATDLADWQGNYGSVAGIGSAANTTAVPEPSTTLLLSIAALVLGQCRRRR